MRIPDLCLAILCSLFSLAGLAQDTTWYGAVGDNNPRRISSIITKTDSGWRVVNYYTTGKASSIGLFADDSCTIPKGDRVYYVLSGRVSRRVHFENGKASGNDTYYYESGRLLASGVNREGAPDGEWKAWYRTGKLAAKASFSGGHQTAVTYYNEDGAAIKNEKPFFQESTYPDGVTGLYEYLDANIKYPASAVVYDKQGVVVLQFHVTTEGNIEDLELIQNVDPALDKEAYRVVSGMKPWNPARIGGIPVDTYKRLPIDFSPHQ